MSCPSRISAFLPAIIALLERRRSRHLKPDVPRSFPASDPGTIAALGVRVKSEEPELIVLIKPLSHLSVEPPRFLVASVAGLKAKPEGIVTVIWELSEISWNAPTFACIEALEPS